MCSNDAAIMSDGDLYNRVNFDNISRLAGDCLLVMTFVVENSKADEDLSYARDARSIARSIRQSVPKFVIDTLEGPLQVVKKEIGLVANSAVERLSRSLKIPRGKFGLQYFLKTNLQTMIQNLNKSFTYESKSYSTDLHLIQKAFYSFANQLEHALEQHLVATTIPETEDTLFIAKLSSLNLDAKKGNSSTQIRPASSAIDRTRQYSPQKHHVATIAASLSQTGTLRVCFQCKQPGHFKDRCPQTQCYRCVY